MGQPLRKPLSDYQRALIQAGEDVRKAGVVNLTKEIQARGYGKARTYTPDINELEHKQRCKIFVPDDMMTGGLYHDYITETNLFGRWPACTGYTEDNFTYYDRVVDKDRTPIVLDPLIDNVGQGAYVHQPARVWGQIYVIRGAQFTKLDFLKENGYAFLRQRREIRIPHQKAFLKPSPDVSFEMTHYMDCYMYVGIKSYWLPLLDGGYEFQPVKQIEYKGIRARPWLERYYVYQNGKLK